MKIEFEIDDAALTREIVMQAEALVKIKCTREKSQQLVWPVVERQIAEYMQTLDLKPQIKVAIDAVVEEIVQQAVNSQIRGLARSIVQQEIEKVRAAHIEPAKVRET